MGEISLTRVIKPKNITKVVVLHGGISEEKEVSNSTAESCIEALKRIEFDVEAISVDSANIYDLAEIIKVKNPDVIFNALHGGIGENGTIQGLFEILRVPYTHSGVVSSAIAMDKFISKKIFKTSGLPVIEDQLLNAEDELSGISMKPPFVIKPNNGGSSVGIRFIRHKEQIEEMRTHYGHKDREYLLEKYISGRELTVAVLNGRPLTVTDIVTDDWYNYEATLELKFPAPSFTSSSFSSISEKFRPSFIAIPGRPPSLTKRFEQAPIGITCTSNGTRDKNLDK